MDPARPSNPTNYLTLREAADILAVDIDVLLSWNEHNILKPTITPTGEIGYTKEQIDQFAKIRDNAQLAVRENSLEDGSQFSQNIPSPFENVIPGNSISNSTNQQANNFSQINNYNFYNSPVEEPAKKSKTMNYAFGILAGFSILITVAFVIFISQENRINAMLLQNRIGNVNNSNVLAANTSDINLQEKNKLSSADTHNVSKTNKLSNEGGSINQNRISSLRDSENKDDIATKTYKEQVAILESIIGGGKKDGVQPGLKPDNGTSSYTQKATYSEGSYCPECANNSDSESAVFDTDGNIKVSKKESDENKLIATRLAMGGMNQSQIQVKQNTNSVTLVSFLILGFFGIYVIYSRKGHFFPSFENHQNLDIQPQNTTSIIENPRILEVFQKTDGTVVLMLQGKEYKISKPELDSESDKFIDRLMHLVGSNIKEVEYDSLQDEELLINTPLSKLVTRLGFVGIKRDLFFPRTSKTRVYFRKYLTVEDLLSMNLTAKDITSGFSSDN